MTEPPAAHSNDAVIGQRLAQAGRWDEALPFLERALASRPGDAGLLHMTASVLQIVGRPHDAVQRYASAPSPLAEDTGVLVGWARALLRVGDEAAATGLLDRALGRDPRIASSAGSLRQLWNPEEREVAVRVLRALTSRHPDNSDLLCQYAQVLRTAECLEEAAQAWQQYMQRRPDDPLGPVEAGRLAVSRGDRAAAHALFERALQIAPGDARALAEAAHLQRAPLTPDFVARLEAAIARERHPEQLAQLHDALARHYERQGEHRHAAAAVARMNAVRESAVPPQRRYDPGQHAEEVAYAIRTYRPALFERLREAGRHDRRPVFVIGLPRSGTTLLERMLAAHPEVVGVGEQSFAREGLLRALAGSDGGVPDVLTPALVDGAAAWHLRQLEERLQRQMVAGGGARIVDKLPDNYLLAGWLRIAFPDAVLIHSLRDPRDVAWSCWATDFARIDWSLRLEHIAHRIEQHRLLLRHWRQVMSERLVELRYERLVADPETELRRLLAAIGMDWHPAVLAFAQQQGFVASASRHQVREGVHGRSIGRWRNYTEALAPILPRLEAVVASDARAATAELRL